MPGQHYKQLLAVEGRPSSMSKQQYIEQAVQQLLVDDVAWQFDAVQQGFHAVLDPQVSWPAMKLWLRRMLACHQSLSKLCILKGTTCTGQVQR